MKRLSLVVALGLVLMTAIVVILPSAPPKMPEVSFQPVAAYDHPINGRSFRFNLTNLSSSFVEAEIIGTERKITNGWQVITNISSPELFRLDPDVSPMADVPLPVGSQTWRAVLRYRKFAGHVENSVKKVAHSARLISSYTPAPWTTNFSAEIQQ